MPPLRPHLDVEAAADAYLRGLSLDEVASRHGVSAFYVRTRLLDAGVKLRPRSVRRKWRGEV